jgi:hypothetical protein
VRIGLWINRPCLGAGNGTIPAWEIGDEEFVGMIVSPPVATGVFG